MPKISRQTKQKEQLSLVIRKFPSFFNAKDLEDESRLSLATIYRYLKAEVAAGNLFSYACEGQTIYSTTKRSHCHYICEKTGRITHFDVDSLDFLKKKIPGSIESFQIEVRGVCSSCK
ncbi:MAG: transcriptional repressor [Nanoarchaeota archaeon]|nr:transcriptional repressor [Nanoarchaeota archaeon]